MGCIKCAFVIVSSYYYRERFFSIPTRRGVSRGGALVFSRAIAAKNVHNSWRNLVIIYTTLCGFAFIASNQHKFQHFYTFLFSIVSCISLVISDWNFFLQMLNRLDLFPGIFLWKKFSNEQLDFVHLRCHLNMFGWVNLSVVVSFEKEKNKRNGKQCDNEIPSVDHQLIEEFWGLVAVR